MFKAVFHVSLAATVFPVCLSAYIYSRLRTNSHVFKLKVLSFKAIKLAYKSDVYRFVIFL